MKNNNYGGKREGAGAKKKKDKLIKNQIYLTKEADEIINQKLQKGLYTSAAITEKFYREKEK